MTAAEIKDRFLKVDTELMKDAVTLPIFQHPAAFAVTSSLEGVRPSPLAPNLLWNFWEWTFPGLEKIPLFSEPIQAPESTFSPTPSTSPAISESPAPTPAPSPSQTLKASPSPEVSATLSSKEPRIILPANKYVSIANRGKFIEVPVVRNSYSFRVGYRIKFRWDNLPPNANVFSLITTPEKWVYQTPAQSVEGSSFLTPGFVFKKKGTYFLEIRFEKSKRAVKIIID
jgi:hypothetical protein